MQSVNACVDVYMNENDGSVIYKAKPLFPDRPYTKLLLKQAVEEAKKQFKL